MIKKVAFLCFTLFITNTGFSQKNIQFGYDFGSFRIPYTGQKNFNSIHRLNISGEYIFPSNILLSLNFGYDINKVNYFFSYETNVNIGSYKFSDNYDMDIQTFKTGLSLGYNLELGEASNVQFRLNFDGYFVSNYTINKLMIEERFYDVPVEQMDDNTPASTKVEHDPNLIDMEKIRTANRYFILSLHYKYEIKNYFISPHIAFSPWNRGFILSEGQNLYLAGIRLGYTFPQNSEKDEK